MKHVNISAYETVEELSNFTTAGFRAYCDAKLASCRNYVDFIRKNYDASTWRGIVCEIGSGNGRLLFRMEQEGLLAAGVGYEISPSRCRFAAKFKDYVQSKNVVFRPENALNQPSLEAVDLVIGIDLVFQLIAPLRPTAQKDILTWINRSLRRGGYLLLELMDFEHILKLISFSKDEIFYWWEEYPDYDPWEFILARFWLDQRRDIVWEKRFIRRGSAARSNFTNILRNYTPESICQILENSGFSACVYREAESGIKLEPGEFIVWAQKIHDIESSGTEHPINAEQDSNNEP